MSRLTLAERHHRLVTLVIDLRFEVRQLKALANNISNGAQVSVPLAITDIANRLEIKCNELSIIAPNGLR